MLNSVGKIGLFRLSRRCSNGVSSPCTRYWMRWCTWKRRYGESVASERVISEDSALIMEMASTSTLSSSRVRL
jgi:hypothetical protein